MWHMYIVLVGFCASVLGNPVNYSDDQECITNSDCPLEKVCINDKCVDPCVGVCGPNTICQVVNLSPMCSCKPGYVGHPFTGCSPGAEAECTSDSHCPLEKTCLNLKCVDPCIGACGLNSLCKVTNHRHICACKDGFAWSSFKGCQPIALSECISDIHCPEDKVCINQTCVDPCFGLCGNNTVCQAINHHAACACVAGYKGNPFQGCHEQHPYQLDALNSTWITKKSMIPSDVKLKREFYFGPNKVALEHCFSNGKCLVSINSEADLIELENTFRDAEVVDVTLSIVLSSKKKFYIGTTEKVTWSQAFGECLSRNMSLATINSQKEQDEVESLIRRSVLAEEDASYWISGSVDKGSGNVSWNATGTALSYTNWGKDEPWIFGDYRCLLVDSGKFVWMLFKCSEEQHIICEY